MRNWNLSALPIRCLLEASRLPMRNWNRSWSWERTTGRRSASRLPMRNWNLDYLFFIKFCLASRLPMRNWNNSSRLITRTCLGLLPDYLWGIETKPKSNAVYLLLRFQTTYEELKPTILMRNRYIGQLRFQTTYEELKLHIVQLLWISRCFQTTYEELKRSGEWETMMRFSFQTTYEELKLVSGQDSRLSFFCFQTTYEELKHSFKNQVDVFQLCFQTTYEELKPWCRRYFFFMSSASRLPMRNWNLAETSHRRYRLTRLPDYLWGIETVSQSQRLKLYQQRFQTTYEELKRKENHELRQTLEGLPDYLWGIETRQRVFSQQAHGFQTTYEELKHLQSSRVLRTKPASRLPMRNWNVVKGQVFPLWK